jgi:hypothetical protein
MTERHCRYYAQARHAGEPTNLYPAWNATLELELGRWARSNASSIAFRSLMAVADPNRWPIDQANKAEWIDVRRAHAEYQLASERHVTAQPDWPTAAEFFSGLVYANLFGALSWISVNRTAQRRLDNQHASSTLALMVGMGLLDPAAGWQDRHRVTIKAKEVMTLVAAELSETGNLSWRKGTLARLLDSLSEAPPETDLGWCARPEIDALLEVERSAHPEPAEGGTEGLGDLDELFSSADWVEGFAPPSSV